MDLTNVQFRRGNRIWTATATPLEDEQIAIRPDKPIKVEGLKLPRKKAAERGEPLFSTPSFVSLEMEFSNDVNTAAYGLYRFEHEGEPYLVTQFEADDAREAFPCIDLPDAKVALWMELTVPAELTALSNAPIRSVETDEEAGTKTVTFQSTRAIPTYAMALAVGPYESIPIAGLPNHIKGQLYTVKGRTELGQGFADEIGPLFHSVEDWFGTPYPYRKLDFVAVPEFAFGGMENPGLVVVTDRMLVPPDQMSPGGRRRNQEVIAHEIAHMWFGNLVTLKWWDDFWLNESFAEFAGNRTAYLTTSDEGFELGRVSTTQYALQSDGRGTMRPVRTEVDPTRIFETTNFLAYPKGEALLTMVENWLGRDVFIQGVRTYLDTHKDGNATASDLFAALSEASEKDVGAMLAPWLDRPGGPVVHIDAKPDGTFTYEQERYLAAGAEAESEIWWTVPMVVRWADDAGVHRDVVLLDAAKGEASIPVKGELKWFFPHADGIAYMAWTLPTEQLSALIDATPENLSPAERSALVGNLDLLTTAGHLTGGELLGLLERFSAETHPRVMGDVLSAQGFAGMVLEDEHEDAWGAYVRATRGPWLERLGLEPTEGEDEAIPGLRARLIGQLIGPGEDEALKDMLRPIGQAFLDDEAAYDPSLTGMGRGDPGRRSRAGLPGRAAGQGRRDPEPPVPRLVPGGIRRRSRRGSPRSSPGHGRRSGHPDERHVAAVGRRLPGNRGRGRRRRSRPRRLRPGLDHRQLRSNHREDAAPVAPAVRGQWRRVRRRPVEAEQRLLPGSGAQAGRHRPVHRRGQRGAGHLQRRQGRPRRVRRRVPERLPARRRRGRRSRRVELLPRRIE